MSYGGIAGECGFEPQLQGPADCLLSDSPSRAALRCRPGPPALQGRGHGRVRRHNRALGEIRTLTALADHMALNHARLPFRHEHLEPSPGADPGLLPYEGKVTSRVRRPSYRDWNRTSVLLIHTRTVAPAGNDPASPAFQADANPSQLESLESGGRDSNPVCLVPNQAR